MRRIATDILVLGTGGAGLFAALHARKLAPQLEVTIAVKGLLGKCGCTRMVQGGYNVALAAGLQGWLLRATNLFERALLVIAGLLVIAPVNALDYLGIAMMLLALGSQLLRMRRAPA